jgi:hypothetical protein
MPIGPQSIRHHYRPHNKQARPGYPRTGFFLWDKFRPKLAKADGLLFPQILPVTGDRARVSPIRGPITAPQLARFPRRGSRFQRRDHWTANLTGPKHQKKPGAPVNLIFEAGQGLQARGTIFAGPLHTQTTTRSKFFTNNVVKKQMSLYFWY